MGGYVYKYFAKEFAIRANENYNNIYHQYEINKEHSGVFEVNALITALYGIVVLPTEAYKVKFQCSDKIDEAFVRKIKESEKTSYEEFEKIISGLYSSKENRIRSTYEDDGQIVTPFRFIYHLRNALSHSGSNGMNFIPITINGSKPESDKEDITDIYFHDESKYGGRYQEFCAKISIENLIAIKDCILDIVLCDEFYEDESRRSYNPIDNYNKFLKGNKRKARP